METTQQSSTTLRKVPTLSLGSYLHGSEADKVKFIEQLFHGMKDYGFIILKDHDVSPELLSQAYQVLEKFYSLSEDKKLSYVSELGGGQRGYTAFGKEHAKDSPVKDLKEFWHVGREVEASHAFSKYYPKNIWPNDTVPEFKPLFEKLFSQLETAGMQMMEALTYPLQVEKDYFKNMVVEGNSILRLLHYPPIPQGVDPRCVRAAAHEDINFITILPAATTSGLQLKDRDGTWLDIESDYGTLIVDAGDMLARITNDLIPSTTHRVINPQDGKNSSRYSMPFFMHPHPESLLTCLPSCRGSGAKYPDITAHDFLMQRLREIGLIK
ncbi:MAG: isopenicillin N synthase family oxygenase [Bdellovibrionaceae bacterium]|nr:isopenicillin N synthase family oxygenase [Bdellovibrio sp.]